VRSPGIMRWMRTMPVLVEIEFEMMWSARTLGAEAVEIARRGKDRCR
jgi:hypothetical protein